MRSLTNGPLTAKSSGEDECNEGDILTYHCTCFINQLVNSMNL